MTHNAGRRWTRKSVLRATRLRPDDALRVTDFLSALPGPVLDAQKSGALVADLPSFGPGWPARDVFSASHRRVPGRIYYGPGKMPPVAPEQPSYGYWIIMGPDPPGH